MEKRKPRARARAVYIIMGIVSVILPIIISVARHGSVGCGIVTTIFSIIFYIMLTGVFMIIYKGWNISGEEMLFGLPQHFVTLYVFILSVLIMIIFGVDESKVATALCGLSVGIFSPLISWFGGLREHTACYNETEVHILLSRQGLPHEQIQQKIAELRASGIIP